VPTLVHGLGQAALDDSRTMSTSQQIGRAMTQRSGGATGTDEASARTASRERPDTGTRPGTATTRGAVR
jgi:hypothetical protein